MPNHELYTKLWRDFNHAFSKQQPSKKSQAKSLSPQEEAANASIFLDFFTTIGGFTDEARGDFFAFIIANYHNQPNLLHVFALISRHAINLGCLLPYKDPLDRTHQVSLITFLSQFNNLELMTFFVETIQLKIQDTDLVHPIAIAQQHHHKQMQAYLLKHIQRYSKYTPLTFAAHYGDAVLLSECLGNQHPDINALDGLNLTLLMHAVSQGHWPIITTLLARKADPFVKNTGQQTCLHLLFSNLSDAQIEQFTLASEACKQALYFNLHDLRDHNSLLPIHYAIHHNRMSWLREAFDINPNLLNVLDARRRPLAFSAIERGNLELLRLLHQKSALIREDFDLNKLLSYCKYFEKNELIEWVFKTFKLDLSLCNPLIAHMMMSAIESQKIEQIKWWLSRPSINVSIGTYQPNASNHIAVALAKAGLFDLIEEFDLYGKNKLLLFSSDNYGYTSLDYSFKDFYDRHGVNYKLTNLMVYALPFLHSTETPYIWKNFKQYIEMVSFCLTLGLLSVNELCNGEPLFHAVETHFFQRYEAQLKQDPTTPLSSYQVSLQTFMDEFKLNLNAKDSNGLHLIAKLMLKEVGYQRIPWLIKTFSGFKITDLDANGSSLLQLACQYQLFELVKWCCEARSLSVTKPRKDNLNALDIALQSEHLAIAKYLSDRLNDKQYQQALKNLSGSAVIVLQQHDYFGRPPIISVPHSPEDIKEPEVAVTKEFPSSNTIITAASRVLVTHLPEQLLPTDTVLENELSYVYLKALIQEGALSKIKLLKQDRYQPKLQELTSDEFLDLNRATNYRYNICYHLLRVPAWESALASHWLPLYHDIVEQMKHKATLEIQDLRLLVLFNKYAQKSTIAAFGFELLVATLSAEYQQIFLTLLLNQNIAATASSNNNQLLIRAAELGLAEIIAVLLGYEPVRAHAATDNNAALSLAARAGDYGSCDMLLQLECVQANLANDDYAKVHLAAAEDGILFSLMRAIPLVGAYLDATSSQIRIPDDLASVTSVISELTAADQSTDFPLGAAALVLPVTLPFPLSNVTLFALNPSYLPNEHVFYDAIILGDVFLLERLLAQVVSMSEPMIFQMTSFAVLYNQPVMLNQLLQWAKPVFMAHPRYCNYLLCQAMRLQRTVIMDILFTFEAVRSHPELFDNRLLRCAIQMEYISFAHSLLGDPKVRASAHAVDNAALRVACLAGFAPLVELLLTCPEVRRTADIWDNFALRMAYGRQHHEIIQLLLRIPHVFFYALKQESGQYDAWVVPLALQTVDRWILNPSRLNREQCIWRNHLEEYLSKKDYPELKLRLGVWDDIHRGIETNASLVSGFFPQAEAVTLATVVDVSTHLIVHNPSSNW